MIVSLIKPYHFGKKYLEEATRRVMGADISLQFASFQIEKKIIYDAIKCNL